MTNADKYLRDGITPAIFCKACTTGTINVCALAEWLRKEAKPTLSEDEKIILSNVSKKYEVIARDKDQELGAYNLYVKTIQFDDELDWSALDCFNHLFQFIQPRRRI